MEQPLANTCDATLVRILTVEEPVPDAATPAAKLDELIAALAVAPVVDYVELEFIAAAEEENSTVSEETWSYVYRCRVYHHGCGAITAVRSSRTKGIENVPVPGDVWCHRCQTYHVAEIFPAGTARDEHGKTMSSEDVLRCVSCGGLLSEGEIVVEEEREVGRRELRRLFSGFSWDLESTGGIDDVDSTGTRKA
jgi:hypothetical protein